MGCRGRGQPVFRGGVAVNRSLQPVDAQGRLRGSVKLGRMLRTKRPVPIIELADPEIPAVPADTPQEEVAHLFRDQDLVSCHVVDRDRRLLGVIMVDDIVDVIDEEAADDLLRMGGVGVDDIHANTVRTTQRRAEHARVVVSRLDLPLHGARQHLFHGRLARQLLDHAPRLPDHRLREIGAVQAEDRRLVRRLAAPREKKKRFASSRPWNADRNSADDPFGENVVGYD